MRNKSRLVVRKKYIREENLFFLIYFRKLMGQVLIFLDWGEAISNSARFILMARLIRKQCLLKVLENLRNWFFRKRGWRKSLKVDNSANYGANSNFFTTNSSERWNEANESKIVPLASLISEIKCKSEIPFFLFFCFGQAVIYANKLDKRLPCEQELLLRGRFFFEN